MSPFTRDMLFPFNEFLVNDDSAANPGPHDNAEYCCTTCACAIDCLAESEAIGVVRHADFATKTAL